MRVAKVALVGVVIAVAIGAIVLYWEYVAMGVGLLVAALIVIGLATSQPAPSSREEQERQRRSFVNYQISQDSAERREAHYEAMAQWRQQPPSRDPGSWGGGDGGRFC